MSHVVFVVKSEHMSVLFVDELIITWLSFAFFDCFLNPFFEFQSLSVIGAVESELKILLTFPKLFRSMSKYFSLFRRHVILLLVVITGLIGSPESSVAILIK